MKILMLGWELPPFNSGGLGVACYELCKVLAKKGADIEFVVPYLADHKIDFMRVTATQPISADEVNIAAAAYASYEYNLDDYYGQESPIASYQSSYESAVEQIVTLGEFDVIHAHDWLTFRAALRAKEVSGVPLIVHVHSIESDRSGGNHGNPLVREIEYNTMMLADRVIAVSKHTKQSIEREYHIPPNKIAVVHNSIEAMTLPEITTENVYHYCQAMKQQGYSVVSNVGRLTIQKGLPNLLRAMQLVIDHQPKTLLLIVGTGEQDYELIQLAAELGIGGNVIFTGFQRGRSWRDAFRIADLFVMPSVSEPFGLTPLEAIGYGAPSLISKQSGVAEVLKSCLKVDYWDVKEMANQITGAVRSQALRAELTNNARNEYQRLSWNTAADRLMGIYEQHKAAMAL